MDEAKQRVHDLEERVQELKLQRVEDAKANEKVVGIFAVYQQTWISERKGLQQALQLKDDELSEERRVRSEVEEKLALSDVEFDELRERVRMEAEEHSGELRKLKTAFLELVSNQRQLEAELGRAVRQGEAVREEKEEAVVNMEKFRKDAEQKERILSAMLRKSKVDGAEKGLLLKELKNVKVKKKQAEVDCERWRMMLEAKSKSKKGWILKGVEAGGSEVKVKSSECRLLDYLKAESRKEHDLILAKRENIVTTGLDHYLNETDDLEGIQDLQDWVRLETEKYVTNVEERHCTDIEAFMEQLRLKDEKLESYHWQLLAMEHESRRLETHIEGLGESILQLKDENMKLGHKLLDRENDLKLLKEQLNFYIRQQRKSNSKAASPGFKHQPLSSEMKAMNKLPREKEQESDTIANYKFQEMEDQVTSEDASLMQLDSPVTTSSSNLSSPTDRLKEYSIIYINELSSKDPITTESSIDEECKSTMSLSPSHNEEIEDDTEVNKVPVHISRQNSYNRVTKIANEPTCTDKNFAVKASSWKMDIHALGVSYKIKRLKQQLLVLEKVSGIPAMNQHIKQNTPDGSKERKIDMNSRQIKGLPVIISFLNKHAKRYQSLEEKTNELCKRMHEIYRSRSSRDANNDMRKEQTDTLEKFLGETFQLQRYMVATGQKLLEIQSKITSSFSGSHGLDESIGFNMRQFADIVGNLFTEIQRGLEMRLSRVIGDLEGTLACDGILHS